MFSYVGRHTWSSVNCKLVRHIYEYLQTDKWICIAALILALSFCMACSKSTVSRDFAVQYLLRWPSLCTHLPFFQSGLRTFSLIGYKVKNHKPKTSTHTVLEARSPWRHWQLQNVSSWRLYLEYPLIILFQMYKLEHPQTSVHSRWAWHERIGIHIKC